MTSPPFRRTQRIPGTTFCALALMAACQGGDRPVHTTTAVAAAWSVGYSGHVREFGADSAAVNRRPGIIVGYHAVMLTSDLAAIANYDHVLLYNFASDAARSVGRRGEGPGEFSRLSDIFAAAPGFVTADNSGGRLIRFDTAGTVLGTATTAARTAVGWIDAIGPVARRGGLRSGRTYVLHDSAGQPALDLLVTAAPPDLIVETRENGGSSFLILDPACDPPDLAATIGRTLFVAEQKSGTVVAVDTSGASRVVHRSSRRLPITQAVLDRVKLSFTTARPADVEALLARFGAPGDSMPITWDRMIADASGRLWLRYSGCANDQERTWDIVDTSGTHRGWFRTRNHIIAAYDSFFLARGADSLGVPAITRWRIVRQ